MPSDIGKVTVNKPMQYMTLTVEVQQPYCMGLRFWIAAKLFRLAAFVLGCGIEVKPNECPPT